MMRVRFLSLLSALVLLGLAAVPAQASEDRGGGGDGGSYLALGDSVPFGFSPLLNAKDADNFVGYPEIAAQKLDLRDVNATCPGEATGGFLSLTGTDNVCRPYRFVAKDPLHVRYKTSQMAFALSYLRAHKHNTRLVTLTLGANDVFRFQKDCAAGPTVGTCPLGLGGVAATMQANLNTILGGIRATGYKGLIVAVTYYALDYHDVSGSVFLNGPMKAAAAAHGALIADGLAAWAPAAAGGSSCVAGLLIVTSTSPLVCDVHPTPKGRDLLATAVVNTVAASCAAHDAEECLGERD
jgi:lysophospholipase L1-like esterase